MKKKIIIPTLVLTAFLAVGILSSEIYAQSTIPIHKLANQFEIDELEVNAVIDAIRDEQETNKDLIFGDWLQKLQDDESINELQKLAIIEKRGEIKKFKLNLSNMNNTEKSNAKKYFKIDMMAWGEKWNIDLDLLNINNKSVNLGYGLGDLRNV